MAKTFEKKLEKISLKATSWIGSTQSLVVHTLFFIGIFLLGIVGVSIDKVLLILTTAVSLEAIYLAIFIQMTVNRNTQSLESVEDDIEDIQEDVKGLEDNIEDISDDIEEIQEDSENEEVAQHSLENVEEKLHKLQSDFENLKNKTTSKSSTSTRV